MIKISYKIISGYYDLYNNVHLVVLNDKGKFIKTIKGCIPYIYIKTEDYEKPAVRGKLDEWKENKIISKVIADTNPDFKKVFLTNPRQTYEIREWLKQHHIYPHEADIPYVRRVMIDKKIGVGDKKMRRLYVDIETDDSKHGIEIGRDRILSIGCMDENGESWFLTGNSETELLKKFKKLIIHYDLLITWYGERFDFPYIEIRCKINNVFINWRYYQRLDFYKVFRATRRAGIPELYGGYGLDNVGERELGLKKIPRSEKIITLYVTDIEKLKDYNMRDVLIMYEIEKKLNLISQQEMLSETAGIFIENISGTTILDTLVLRKVSDNSLPYRFKCKGWYIDEGNKKDRIGYGGAYVFVPIPGVHKNVIYLDFTSLYDSIARSFNICFTTVDVGDDISTPAGLCKFTNKKRGLLPEMMEMLAKKVKSLKSKILEAEGKGDMEDAERCKLRMWSLKNILKSFYGQMGSQYSRYYDKRLAESITKTGQWLIKKTAKELENNGYTILAGDTDSIMVKIDDKNIIETGKKIVTHLNDCYKRWIEPYHPWENLITIKFEKIFKQIIFIGDVDDPSKKRYTGIITWDEGIEINKIVYVGLEIIRSDWGDLSKKLQKDIIDMIFNNSKKEPIINFINENRDIVTGGKLNKEDLVLHKKINKSVDKYGNGNGKGVPVHVRVAEDMIERGIDVWPGLTIPYIVVGREDNKIKAIYAEDFKGEYDQNYYWNKQIYSPSCRVLKSVFPDFEWEYLMLNPKIGKFIQSKDQKSLGDFA